MFYLLNLSLPVLVLLSSLLLLLSASTWFVAWVALELNMLAFIPMIITANSLTSEAALKYFFVQVVGSVWVFFFMLYSYFYTSLINNYLSFISFPMLVFLALALKLGVAPFHFWFPALIEGLSWNTSLLLMTLQKLGPLSLLLLITKQLFLVALFSVLSALVGAISGLNQLLCRKLMSYSSIAHLGWLICASSLTKTLVGYYFVLYAFMTSLAVLLFKAQNSYHMNQVFFHQTSLIPAIVVLYLNLVSLGGLPPFLGFMPSWLVIKMSMNNTTTIIILILSSVITLYFYLRLTYTALMIVHFKPLLMNYAFAYQLMLRWLILAPILTLPLACFLL